jgi:DNA modification methylase
MSVRILVGDARAVLATLPAESVHCVVTSPPYWGLRDYGLPPTVWGGVEGCAHTWGAEQYRDCGRRDGGEYVATSDYPGRRGTDSEKASTGVFCARCHAWQGSLGLEPDPALYVAHLVEVFRAVRRVLRADGTCWVNLGDSYANTLPRIAFGDQGARGPGATQGDRSITRDWSCWALKPKDLAGIPWRVAFALQADGWWLRSEIIWHKPNPMPESVTDRPTKAHEQLFLLAKAERYYFDAEAIKERGIATENRGGSWTEDAQGDRLVRAQNHSGPPWQPNGFRNRRSVWTIATEPFSEAHFATFPPALVEPCLKAGTSERGACPACGAPWRREFETDPAYRDWAKTQRFYGPGGLGSAFRLAKTNSRHAPPKGQTTGWAPTCACAPGLAPGVVEPCVQAGTSEKGCCAQCGAPWRRVITLGRVMSTGGSETGARASNMATVSVRGQDPKTGAYNTGKFSAHEHHTTGWAPTCACAPGLAPGVVEPCVQAGTSERGCCAKCGAPWRREVERGELIDVWGRNKTPHQSGKDFAQSETMAAGLTKSGHIPGHQYARRPLGWAPTCACAPQPVPCVVLDPFAGAGTVGLVADRLGRDAILIELKPEYAAMAERRIREEAPLLTAVAVEGEPVESPPGEPGGKASTTPRNDGTRWTCEGFSRPDGQPWASRARALPPASDNGPGALAPEQLAFFEADA